MPCHGNIVGFGDSKERDMGFSGDARTIGTIRDGPSKTRTMHWRGPPTNHGSDRKFYHGLFGCLVWLCQAGRLGRPDQNVEGGLLYPGRAVLASFYFLSLAYCTYSVHAAKHGFMQNELYKESKVGPVLEAWHMAAYAIQQRPDTRRTKCLARYPWITSSMEPVRDSGFRGLHQPFPSFHTILNITGWLSTGEYPRMKS